MLVFQVCWFISLRDYSWLDFNDDVSFFLYQKRSVVKIGDHLKCIELPFTSHLHQIHKVECNVMNYAFNFQHLIISDYFNLTTSKIF